MNKVNIVFQKEVIMRRSECAKAVTYYCCISINKEWTCNKFSKLKIDLEKN